MLSLYYRHADRIKRTLCILLVGLVAMTQLLWFAWISDDAAITLRTVLNLNFGYGAVFNVGERVQAYTHPLWFLLLSLAQLIIGNVMTATIVVSVIASVAAIMLITQVVATSIWTGYAAAAILMLSKAYLDFSVSGLENPLSHLLVVAFALVAVRACANRSISTYTWLLLLFSLMYLGRPDLILIGLPLVGYATVVVRPGRSTFVRCALIGALPAVLWTLFSLVYYGSLVPNTAYAKLGAGVPLIDSVKQGWLYYKNSFERDPVTLWTITLGILVGLISKPIDRCLSLGVVMYLVYILGIGGDFMSGRFFTVPLVASVVILAGNSFKKPVIAVFLIGYGCAFCKTSVLKHEVVGTFSSGSIADERLFYYGRKNFTSWKRQYPHYESVWGEYAKGSLPRRLTQTCGGMGYQGLEGGPALHLVDACGLADPLLARLPARPNQRVGHYHRVVPTNYELSAYSGQNMLVDYDIKSYYDDIRIITREPLFDFERLKTIARLLIHKTPEFSRWRSEMTVTKYTPDTYIAVDAAQLALGSTDGARWDARESTVIYGAGLEVIFSKPEKLSVIDIVVDNNDGYRIEYFDGSDFKPLFVVGPSSDTTMAEFIPSPVPFGMIRYKRAVPMEIPVTTRIRITPEGGDGVYSVGRLVTREP